MEENYGKCIKYIKNHWKRITFLTSKNKGIHIGLPNKYISPNDKIFIYDQFYWDSYFIILGLVASGEVSLAKGIVDNFIYLYKRFGIIPARNRFYDLGISQPPFLTSMIMEIFQITKDKNWLKKAAKVAENELKNYWMNKKVVERHLVYKGLSRYCDHFITHLTAEHESGWDTTSRFNDHCLDYLPIDLNTLLYKYEIDLADISKILGESEKRDKFLKKAKMRKQKINELMWNSRKEFFFDYNYHLTTQSDFYSIAGFYPLWANLASKRQARKLKNNLKLFEYGGGLANTQKENLSKEFKQHDYPNGWPHQQWIVIKGLLNYGFKQDAERLAKKWLNLNKKMFLKTGKFWEKYDVVKCGLGKSGRYPTQSGFGWTNGVFLKLVRNSINFNSNI